MSKSILCVQPGDVMYTNHDLSNLDIDPVCMVVISVRKYKNSAIIAEVDDGGTYATVHIDETEESYIRVFTLGSNEQAALYGDVDYVH